MFDEVKEMIDSTIYENGRGEVTAQNVNLAMHGVVDATEEELGKVNDAVKTVKDKVTAIEENGTGGGSGALRWWLAHESFGIVNTPEQTQENIATYNKLVEDKYASVILCYGMDMSSISTYTSAPVAVQYAILGGESQMMLCASIAVEEGYPMECIAVMPYPDGTMEVLMWQQTSAPSGPLRVWINEMTGGENNSEQVAENAETFRAMWNEKPQMAILCAAAGLGGFPMMMASPVVVYRLISENGEDMISMAYRDIIDQGNGLEIMETYVYLKQDGTVTIQYES